MTLLATLALATVDTLVVGILADPVSLDPHRATDLVSAAIVSNAWSASAQHTTANPSSASTALTSSRISAESSTTTIFR